MSSSDLAVRVDSLGKCYEIYAHPSDRLKQFLFPRMRRWLGKQETLYFREFWALKNVSFQIAKGECFGILGRNGAGKSTLLQILCGTLTPSSGSVEMNGRVAALLELGAGFNPEFTGVENIYLNASVLGLSKAEVDARFDSILAFADIGVFIHQPVKTYSSGMFVRLAFAIAIHVEPDILIVDEALSVGDIAFQNKCILKIRELRDRGTTLIFVTHDLSTLQLICDRVAWLRNGELVMLGAPVSVCQEYYVEALGVQTSSASAKAVISQKSTGMARFTEAAHDTFTLLEKPGYSVGEPIRFKFAVLANEALARSAFTVSIFRADGDWLIGQTSVEAGIFWEPVQAGGVLHGTLVFPSCCLAPGDYLVALGVNSEDLSVCYALTDLALPFSVRWNYPTWGKFIHPCQWAPLDDGRAAQ
jgi:ABC-type polysaccharide/polyol phosphate transport system ATPase subunit